MIAVFLIWALLIKFEQNLGILNMTREEGQKQLDEEYYNNYDSNSIGGVTSYSYLKGTWRNFCKHYDGDDKCSCKAYPNGIPDKFAIVKWGEPPLKHTNVENDQVGHLTYISIN